MDQPPPTSGDGSGQVRDAMRASAHRWQQFNAWELERLRKSPPNLSETLAWMSEAWDLANRTDPSWGSMESCLEHVRYINQVRETLRRGFERS